MATSELNLITKINDISSLSLKNVNTLSSLTTSINSIGIPISSLLNTALNITPSIPYVVTPITKLSVFSLGYFDMLEYIQYLNTNGVEQVITLNTNSQITGNYNSRNIQLIINIINSEHPNLFFTINVNKSFNVSNNKINSTEFDAQVSGYVSSNLINDKKTLLIGQNNLKGTLHIKFEGTIVSGRLNANISGTFRGDFTGTISGTIVSNSEKINQPISIKIVHTNYLLS